tara:strand:- start:713 stop:1078 length:366 start_codon:yes stop_codon:yes gene_type:complete
MYSNEKNIKAIVDFSEDFTEFQVKHLSLISEMTSKLSPALNSLLLDDYLMDRVNELAEDLYLLASQNLPLEHHKKLKLDCFAWVNNNIRNSSNMSLIALVLWLDGIEDGCLALNEAAGNSS